MERVHCGGGAGGGRNLSSLKPGIRLILHFVNSLSLLRSFGSALREGPGWFTGQALVHFLSEICGANRWGHGI